MNPPVPVAKEKPQPHGYTEPAAYTQRLTPDDKVALDRAFSYQQPTEQQLPLHNEINAAARHFAQVVLECCPSQSPDRSAAVGLIRQARMTANAAIALGPIKLP